MRLSQDLEGERELAKGTKEKGLERESSESWGASQGEAPAPSDPDHGAMPMSTVGCQQQTMAPVMATVGELP
jgi:hypothetical protein